MEDRFGSEHPKVARRLANLAELCLAVGKQAEARVHYQRAVAIEEKEFGPQHPTTLKSLRSYATMLRKMNQTAEAEAVEARVHIQRAEWERRVAGERRVQEVPTALQGISVPDRRQRKERRRKRGRRQTDQA